MARILYLHGLYSKPGGQKPSFLVRQGFDVINPGLPDDDFATSLRLAQAALTKVQPEVIVGSSRGGAVAVNLQAGSIPRVLIAPAWKKWGTTTTVAPPVTILHSQGDEVIPLADSQELLVNSGLAAENLQVVGQDHNMTDPEALAALVAAIEASLVH